MIARRLWTARSVSQRTAIGIGLAGCLYLVWLASAREGPIDTGTQVALYLAALAVLVLFSLGAVPAAFAMVFLGGGGFGEELAARA